MPCVPCIKATDGATLKTPQVSKVSLEIEQHETTRQDSCIKKLEWDKEKKWHSWKIKKGGGTINVSKLKAVLFINLCVWCLFPSPHLQCAVAGRAYCSWWSATLSIWLSEWLRWIGSGQPDRTRWSHMTLLYGHTSSSAACWCWQSWERSHGQQWGETSWSNSIIQSADACCACSTHTLIHSLFHWFTLAFL